MGELGTLIFMQMYKAGYSDLDIFFFYDWGLHMLVTVMSYTAHLS